MEPTDAGMDATDELLEWDRGYHEVECDRCLLEVHPDSVTEVSDIVSLVDGGEEDYWTCPDCVQRLQECIRDFLEDE